jgi:hypothetical protein
MKKLLLTAAAIAAMSTGAFAQQQTINLTAEVPKFCTLGTASVATLTLTSSGNGTVSNPVAPSTLAMTCNAASNITLASSKGTMTYLATEAAADAVTAISGFRNKMEYTAAATGTGLTPASLDTSSATTTGAVSLAAGAINSIVSVAVTANANANLLITGTYTDTLTVTVAPQ